jgi:hypothetical protein
VPYQHPTVVAILGRDKVAGQALELLLRGAGCEARFLGEPVTDKFGELLDGAKLLLLGPALSGERRERLLDGLKDEPTTAKTPVLELITTLGEAHNGPGRQVMWPCKTEELVRHIGEALSSAGNPEVRTEEPPSSDGVSRL